MVDFGEVAERSNATDCKSVALAASEVRILPSPPATLVAVGVGVVGVVVGCHGDRGTGRRE